MKQHTLDGKECNPAKFPNIEDLEKILAEQYFMIEESDRQKNHEKKLSDIEKLKELKVWIEEGKAHLSSRFYQIAKKYDLNRNVLKEAMETGEKKKFEDYIKRIEDGEGNLLYHAERLADKHWLDRTGLRKAAVKYFERLLGKIEDGWIDEYWKEIWELSDNYGFDGNKIIEALESFGEEHNWDYLEDECFSCCRRCSYTENCGEKNTHQCYQHSTPHEYCLS